MDTTTIHLLLQAKCFCLIAEEDARRQTSTGCMLAVMHMQDAVEFTLCAILHENGIHYTYSDRFGDLRKKIDDHFKAASPPKVLPRATQMDMLNTTRGKVKHHASVPSEQDTARCLRDGRTFLEQVFPDYCGLTFGAFSLACQVADDAIRGRLQRAEQQIATGDYLEALISVAYAFDLAEPKKDVLDDLEYRQMLMEAGTDMRRFNQVRQNLPFLVPVPVQKDNGMCEDGVRTTDVEIMAHDSLDTSACAAEKTFQAAVELILHWQEVNLLGCIYEKPRAEGSVHTIRVERWDGTGSA